MTRRLRTAGMLTRGVAAFCLISNLTVGADAQQLPAVPACKQNVREYPIGSEVPGPDGKIHVTYQYTNSRGAATTPDPSVRAAFEGGIAQWNALSNTSGVVFEPARPPALADIRVSFAPSNPTDDFDCGSYDRTEGRIYYGRGFLSRAQSNPAGAVATMAHELGHSLGLADAGAFQPTIMNNPVDPTVPCANAYVTTANVTSNDATKAGAAGGCVQQCREARATVTVREDTASTTPTPPAPQCYARYQVTSYYTCPPGRPCALTRVERVFLGTYCY